MPRRKQARRTTVKDLRSILRLTYEQGLSVRAISERLQISKTLVATYLLRARKAGLIWLLPRIHDDAAALRRARFRLALNHQSAKLDVELRPWKQGLFS